MKKNTNLFKNGAIFGIGVMVLLAAILIFGFWNKTKEQKNTTQTTVVTQVEESESSVNNTTTETQQPDASESEKIKREVEVHYIDVGQGDSTLIQYKNTTILIDCGTYDHGDDVYRYLDKLGIEKITLVIATHPDADHIGGFNYLFDHIRCDKVILPQIPDTIKRTKTELTFINKVKTYRIPTEYAISQKEYKFDKMTLTTFVTAGTYSQDKNDYSVVAKIKYKNASYLFMGDAGKSIENEFMGNGYDLKADILKVGHHGSFKSTSNIFLRYVQPKYAVISCGKNNDYGHPHNEVLFNLQNNNVEILRTDVSGDIVIATDGEKYAFR